MKNKLKKIGEHFADHAAEYIIGGVAIAATVLLTKKVGEKSNDIYSDHLAQIRAQKQEHFEIARADNQQATTDYLNTLKEIAKSE